MQTCLQLELYALDLEMQDKCTMDSLILTEL